MKLIAFPVVYTKIAKLNSSDQSYRAVMADLNLTLEEEGEEVADFIYIQDSALVNVHVSPYINDQGVVVNTKSFLEYGELGNREELTVQMSVGNLLKFLADV